MSLTTDTNKVIFQGNGSAGMAGSPFPYSFIIPDASDAVVTYTDSAGTQTVLSSSQYTISGLNDPNGGTLTYPLTGSPIASGTSLTLERIVPYEQPTVLTNQGAYYPDVVEGAMDNIVMEVQQIAEAVNRTFRFPAVDPSANSNTNLPAWQARVGMLLGFDAQGNLVALPIQAGTTLVDLSASSGAALVGTILSDTGAVVRTQENINWVQVDVTKFGAYCDDYSGGASTDDTAAIQAAVDSVGDTTVAQRSGITLVFPGPCRITGTITIRRKSIVLQGNGWGNRADTNHRASWLRWDGAAGSPMLQVEDVAGFGIRNMRFIGKSSAKPSAAINFKETNDGIPISSNFLENIFVGAWDSETDDAEQFTNGILLDGIGANNSEHSWRNVKFRKVATAIHVGSNQNVNINVDGFFAGSCSVCALYNSGEVNGNNWSFASNAVDIISPAVDDNSLAVDGITHVTRYFSEHAGRMADIRGGGRLILDTSSFNISSDLNSDGMVVKTAVNTSVLFELRDFRFLEASSPATPPYLNFAMGNAGYRQIDIQNVKGWSFLTGGVNGMDVSTTGGNSRAYIRYTEFPSTTGFLPTRVAQNFISGNVARQWDITRYQTIGAHDLRLEDNFVGITLDANRWGNHKGTDGACVAPAIVVGVGGQCVMTTGANASADMAGNGVQRWSALNWSVESGYLIFEERLKVDDITALCLYFGMTDQVAALEMPFTLSAGSLTSNASNAVGFLFDTAATAATIKLVGVRNNTDATMQDTSVAFVADTMMTLRCEVAATNGSTATFYINGVAVGTAMINSVLSTTPLTPVLAAFSRGAASRVITSNYHLTQMDRP